MINDKNLYSYIDLIKVRTGMYIGEKSLSALYFHINGYQLACGYKGINEELKPDFGLFHDFVANYYLRSESTPGWKNMILAENYGNEEKALETFFSLFDDFRKNIHSINTKKVLLKLLEKIILEENNLGNLQQELSTSEYDKLKILLSKIVSVEFLSDYDDIFIEIKSLSINSKKLDSLLIGN